ncbi:MAG: hypothetical protein ABIH66_10470 [bacterium]
MKKYSRFALIVCFLAGMFAVREVSAATSFYILGEEEAGEVKKAAEEIKKEYPEEEDVVVQHLLLAQLYKDKELYMDATDELKALIALDETDLGSRRELVDIYLLTGNAKYAERELEAIEKIRKEQGDPFEF